MATQRSNIVKKHPKTEKHARKRPKMSKKVLKRLKRSKKNSRSHRAADLCRSRCRRVADQRRAIFRSQVLRPAVTYMRLFMHTSASAHMTLCSHMRMSNTTPKSLL